MNIAYSKVEKEDKKRLKQQQPIASTTGAEERTEETDGYRMRYACWQGEVYGAQDDGRDWVDGDGREPGE